MLGNTGVFCNGAMFAMVVDNELYLRVDEQNREAFNEAASHPVVVTDHEPFPLRKPPAEALLPPQHRRAQTHDEQDGGSVGSPNASVHSSIPLTSIMRSVTSPPFMAASARARRRSYERGVDARDSSLDLNTRAGASSRHGADSALRLCDVPYRSATTDRPAAVACRQPALRWRTNVPGVGTSAGSAE